MNWHHKNSSDILEHNKSLEQLLSFYKEKKLHNSLMFSGQKGIGKFECAALLSHYILTDAADSTDISNKMANGSHPDFRILRTAEDSKIISVDQIREINEFLRFTNVESKNKVIIIDSLDNLNNNAANALLKILEEPPLNCYFICLVHSIGKILPTIRSRCSITNFKPISKNAFLEFFKFHEPTLNIEGLYNLSSGSIGFANELIKNNFTEIVSLIRHIVGGNRSYANIKQLAEFFAKDESSWNIAFRILKMELHAKMKKEALEESHNTNSANKIEDLLNFLYNGKKSHLDVQQTILGALL